MSDIQKQIKEALVRHAKNDLSYEWSENMKTIVYNHVEWLNHQQSIISQQAKELGESQIYVYELNVKVREQAEEIERLKGGWEVMAEIPMDMHPSEIREFARKMLKGETPYKLNEGESPC